MRRTVDDLLGAARARLVRLPPSEALAAQAAGALLVDVRGDYDSTAASRAPSASRATYSNGVLTRRAPRAIRASQASMP
jgi:hypothetical protein